MGAATPGPATQKIIQMCRWSDKGDPMKNIGMLRRAVAQLLDYAFGHLVELKRYLGPLGDCLLAVARHPPRYVAIKITFFPTAFATFLNLPISPKPFCSRWGCVSISVACRPQGKARQIDPKPEAKRIHCKVRWGQITLSLSKVFRNLHVSGTVLSYRQAVRGNFLKFASKPSMFLKNSSTHPLAVDTFLTCLA